MINVPLSRGLRLAALLVLAWSCAPAVAGVRDGASPVEIRKTLPRTEPFPGGAKPAATPAPVLMAAADCSGAAAQAAADSGGQVLSVSSSEQGGRTVCIVTVLIPGEDGGRPRKKTITIPQ